MKITTYLLLFLSLSTQLNAFSFYSIDCNDASNTVSRFRFDYQPYFAEQKQSNAFSSFSPSIQLGYLSVSFDIFRTAINIFRYWQLSKKIEKFTEKHHSWNKTQFKNYFGSPGYFTSEKEQEILEHYDFYQFSGFRQYIREFSLFFNYIQALRNHLRSDWHFLESTRKLPGFDTKNFKGIVEDLYCDHVNALQQQARERSLREKQRQEEQEKYQIRTHVEQIITQQKDAIYELYQDYEIVFAIFLDHLILE